MRVLRTIGLDRLLFMVVVVVELTLKSGQAGNLVILWSFDWGFSRISGENSCLFGKHEAVCEMEI